MKKILVLGCLLLATPLVNAGEPAAPALPAAEDSAGFSGKVVETMTTSGYTYVLVDTGSKKLWAAATQFAVKVGDNVAVASSAPMPNYHSKTLNRDFDLVYFTGSITVNGGPAASALPPGHPALPANPSATLPAGHPPLPGTASQPTIDLAGIKRATDGKTVQEIINGKSALAGKVVTVRANVVKYNAMILGKNWLHLRDGSGNDVMHDNDLTITTDTAAKVGDTVLVTGNVSTNRDFGAGYKYSVMLEDAKVVVE